MTDPEIIAVSPQRLRELIAYCPETGVLMWKLRPPTMFKNEQRQAMWNVKHGGKRALAHVDANGYATGSVLGAPAKAHRVAWAIYFGVWPSGVIDHINRIKTDNRIVNLRDVSPAINARNSSLRRDNTTGIVGVSRERGRFTAHIMVDRRRKYIGSFGTITEAAAARLAAEAKYWAAGTRS